MTRRSRKRRANAGRYRLPKEKRSRGPSKLAMLREEQRVTLTVRMGDAKVEQRLVRTIKQVLDRLDNPTYRTPLRMAVYFDHLFVTIEPNHMKRKRRLMKMFRLRPTVEDIRWVNLIWKEQSAMAVRSRRLGIRTGIINKQIS
jgi:hypothetical protein